jgi:3-deoxy-D-manno-octulosonic-acid transferase
MKKKKESRPVAARLRYFVYDVCVHAFLVLLLPYFVYRMLISGKYRRGLKERFGFISAEKLRALSAKGAKRRVVWFHAVSVGETRAAMPLVKLYKEKHPGVKVVFSTVTPTGQDEAARAALAGGPDLIAALVYFPLDLGWVVERVLGLVKPDALVIVEKEYWPNVITRSRLRGVPVAIVNGTMSERSFTNYRRARFIFDEVFGSLSLFSARTDRDREKALALGVAPERAVTAGNLKFDAGSANAAVKAIGKEIGIDPSDAVIVAGSTHAGEEEAILDAYARLRSEFKNLKIVIAPRHPERFNDVAELLKKKGVAFSRRSAGKALKSDAVLLDTMGELRAAYASASVAFVGGTLAPIGGHNLFEPAAFSKPVVFGPHVESCAEMARLITASHAGIMVNDGAGLEEAFRRLLLDDALRMEMGESGRRELERNFGAAQRTIEFLDGALSATGMRNAKKDRQTN